MLYLIYILFLQMNFDHNVAHLQQLVDCSDASPIPPIACNWRNYRYQCARGWEIPYVPRIEAFRSLLGTNSDVATQETINLDET